MCLFNSLQLKHHNTDSVNSRYQGPLGKLGMFTLGDKRLNVANDPLHHLLSFSDTAITSGALPPLNSQCRLDAPPRPNL